MSSINPAAHDRRCIRTPALAASMIALAMMNMPFDAKACADHAAASSEASRTPGTYSVIPRAKDDDASRSDNSHRDPAHDNIAHPPQSRDAGSALPSVRAQSIDEAAPDPFHKRFAPPRAVDPSDQVLLDGAGRSMSQSVFDLPGLMSDEQRNDPRRTGRLEWTSPAPALPEGLAERLRERDGDPATR
jgi:hypothetical protein